MTVIYENETGTAPDLEGESEEDLTERVIEAGLETVKCPYDIQVNVLVTDPDSVRDLNRQFRGIDKETDVLSFPMQEFTSPGDFSGIDENGSDSFDPDTGELLLGDIVLNGQRIKYQAEEYGHSVKREFAFLIAHSFLHLTGYDHMTDEERSAMEEKQREIMSAVGIGR